MKQHYYLVSGTLIFTVEENGQTNVGNVELNALVHDDERNVTLSIIGKAQTGLQLNFRQRQPDPATQIIDVIVANMIYLGHMTKEEFEAMPAGMTLQTTEILNPEHAAEAVPAAADA